GPIPTRGSRRARTAPSWGGRCATWPVRPASASSWTSAPASRPRRTCTRSRRGSNHGRGSCTWTTTPSCSPQARALLTTGPEGRTAYIDADLRDIDAILGSADLQRTLDLSKPVGLLLIAVMHFIPDEDDPWTLAARLLAALPSGSYLALSHLTGDFDPAAWAGVVAVYRRSGVTMQVRPKPDVERFFAGLDLIDPGVVSLPQWRPDPSDVGRPPSDAAVSVYGGVARKP